MTLSPSLSYRGVIRTVKEITKAEGPRALWRGVGARVMFLTPLTAIIFAVYEKTKHILGDTSG